MVRLSKVTFVTDLGIERTCGLGGVCLCVDFEKISVLVLCLELCVGIGKCVRTFCIEFVRNWCVCQKLRLWLIWA